MTIIMDRFPSAHLKLDDNNDGVLTLIKLSIYFGFCCVGNQGDVNIIHTTFSVTLSPTSYIPMVYLGLDVQLCPRLDEQLHYAGVTISTGEVER
jgi:hypothetical protein